MTEFLARRRTAPTPTDAGSSVPMPTRSSARVPTAWPPAATVADIVSEDSTSSERVSPAVARLTAAQQSASGGRGSRVRVRGPAVLAELPAVRRRLEAAPGLWRTPGLRIPMHRATTCHLASLYPLHANAGLGAKGIYMGIDHEAGNSSFHFDPFELYRQGVITSPNMLILGLVGSGKSTVVKTLLYRMLGVLGSLWVRRRRDAYRRAR